MFRLKLIKEQTNLDFMRWHKMSLLFSLLITLACLAGLFTKGLNLGIDFTGGILMEIRSEQPVNIADLRQSLGTLSVGAPSIQEFGNENDVLIRIPGNLGDSEGQKLVVQEVQDILGTEGIDYRRVEFVGPQVGSELIEAGIKAFIYSILGILLYLWFRFEWQFGVAGVVTLAHDAIVTIGFFVFTGIEFDLATVAAVLLVAGYSINDTVVVFDRVRENLRRFRKKPLPELLNLSMNQTLSRTLMTSVTTLLALVALWLFGGHVIRGFVDALIIGIFIGTYSSVFLGTPMLSYMKLRRTPVDEEVTVGA